MSSKPSPVLENVTFDADGSRSVRAFAALAPGQALQARTQRSGPVSAAEYDRNTQSLSDIIAAYFEAWNRHDADAIVATFTAGGIYQDPTTAGPLSGAAIAENEKALWEAFPDLAFTCGSGDRIAVQWHMTGTHKRTFRGLPPTGRSVGVRGADFFELAGGKIASIRGYFDSRAIPEQLGLKRPEKESGSDGCRPPEIPRNHRPVRGLSGAVPQRACRFPLLQKLALPVRLGKGKFPGIKIDDTRLIRLMEILLHSGTKVAGWRAQQIHEAVLKAYGLSPRAYGLNQLRYDLRKMRAHGLLERDGPRYVYRLTHKGNQVALLFLLFSPAPLWPPGQQPLSPPPQPTPRTPEPTGSCLP